MYCICWQKCSFNMKVSCQSTQSHTAVLVIACWAGRSLPTAAAPAAAAAAATVTRCSLVDHIITDPA